ncbi:ankyrin repeat domain-containing protein [Neobacillus niacini]|uniref:ankyrin repeat domain-containing protein n=1 Tax=Neobacillus niacini TaxID=86668 RepID=UPI0007AB6625|nr:ankyrin repeat domain-containing protein [Neobacillus niacini]MEC1525676.1 ankyrin repeat domain-containing protein [Neobacillus niacini]
MSRVAIGVLMLLILTGCSSFNVYKSDKNTYEQNDLMRAVYYQDLNKVKELAQDSSLLHERDVRGANILHYVAKYGTAEMAKLLMELDTKPLLTEKAGARNKTPLQEAVVEGNDGVAKVFYQATPADSKNQVDDEGRTLLHLALVGEQGWLVTKLLQQGMNPNSQDDDGNTPMLSLLYCLEDNICDSNHSSTKNSTREMIDFGLNPYLENYEGKSVMSILEEYRGADLLFSGSNEKDNNLARAALFIRTQLREFN